MILRWQGLIISFPLFRELVNLWTKEGLLYGTKTQSINGQSGKLKQSKTVE